MTYPSPERFPIRGIDVSHHNGTIHWERLAGSGDIRFAYIKATEGGDYKDPKFLDNWNAARKAGLLTGAYHFYRFCKSGALQARNLIETLPIEEKSLPPAIDLEFGGNCDPAPEADELAAELGNFVDELAKAGVKKPVFYATPEFYDAFLKNPRAHFPDHYLWIRSILGEPDLAACAIWQYSNFGLLKGIEGRVDMNALCGGMNDFAARYFAQTN